MANRKGEIVAAAYTILGERGLEDLHARTVAEAVGVNHAAVHYYFPQREHLLLEMVGRARDDWRAALAQADGGKSGRFDALAAAMAKLASGSAPFFRALASLLLAGAEHASVRAATAALLSEMRAETADRLGAVKAKRFLREAGPNPAADLLLSAVLGSGFLAQAGLDGFDARATAGLLRQAVTKE